MPTRFRLASPQESLDKFFGCSHGWPTVVATRGTEVVGAISTHKRDDAVVAGPIEVKVSPPAHLALKLIDAYEQVLFDLGIQEYWFYVDPKKTRWAKAVAAIPFVSRIPHPRGKKIWYKRTLTWAAEK